MDRRAARRMDRVMQLGFAAAFEALVQSGLLGRAREGAGATAYELDRSLVDPERVGVFVGSGLGGVGTLCMEDATVRAEGPRRVSPFAIPMALADSVPGAVAIAFGLKGPNMAHVSACASGANAIGEAFEAIRRGAADVMVAGGSEAAIQPAIVAGFQNMGALSTWQGEPILSSRPFDLERDGFVIGEGAGVLVLERWEFARDRGARILCELAGYGATADAVHVTAPAEDGDGIVRAARLALDGAGMGADAIDCINAHGTSTPLNDAVETIAVKRLLGPRAYDVPMSSIKGVIGHLLGAGGAVEAVAAVKTLETGVVPPTANLHTADPACDLDYVPIRARQPVGGLQAILSNSLGFGGHNAALVLRRA
jgi:3-oxoacyl-[acyl-carrier-protein] synthase II